MRSIYYDKVATPLGIMQVGITEKGICMFEFPIEERILDHKKKFSDLFAETKEAPNSILSELKKQVNEFFEGKREGFNLSLDLVGSEFQCQVWESLLKVPFGKTISYLDLAKNLGNPKSVRAVAKANGINRIPIIIPCHRVIATNGKLTGYSGGLWRKELLLSKENGQNRLTF